MYQLRVSTTMKYNINIVTTLYDLIQAKVQYGNINDSSIP